MVKAENQTIIVTTERSEGVLFECIGYSIKVATRHGTVRPAPTRNRSSFCEANNFFIYVPIELELRI